ncbi:hypothetical protein BD779DRAFT_1177119 [Infundibulicybe gibba]|nr:hypothetical protein BD779DRAFT_1177119 [Infundibulicybe gibba]
MLVVSWGKPPGLPQQDFLSSVRGQAVLVLPIMNAFLAAIVQIFFAWRIWFLNRTVVGRIFVVLIGIIAIIESTGSIIMISLNKSSISTYVPPLWLSGNLLADILIASSMLYTLGASRFPRALKL